MWQSQRWHSDCSRATARPTTREGATRRRIVKRSLTPAVVTLAFALMTLAFPGPGVQAQQPRIYTTTFPATEYPISEGGNWINGKAQGIDWEDVRTTPGFAYGADSSGNPINYNDPTALLTGVWGPNQTVEATVRSVNQTGAANQEVELRLRSKISPHSNTGYEVLFKCTSDGSQYAEIVRWNGPAGNFTYVTRTGGPGIRNGDVVKATIVGNVITGYINGIQVMQGVDSTYPDGNPGMGFFMRGSPGHNADFGLTRYMASDGGTPAPTAPTNLRITPAGFE
jgi:hypothetical protein